MGERPRIDWRRRPRSQPLVVFKATIKRVAAPVGTDARQSDQPRAACATSRSRCASSSEISSRGPRSGGPPNAARTWSQTVRQRGLLRGGTRGHRDELFVESLRKRRRSCSGAVTRKACSWLAACVLASTAERGRPQDPDHLHPSVCALRALPQPRRPIPCPGCCLRVDGIGFSVAPEMAALRHLDLHHRDPPGPQVACESGSVACWYLLPRLTSRAQNPAPSTGDSRNLHGRWHAGLAQASAQMVHDHSHVEVEVCIYAQDHPALGGRLRYFGADRRHVPIPFRSRVHFTTPGSGRERTIL